ncbi:MAG: PadR family transcriptional regulator, partial [Terriglobus sp.]
MFKFSMHCPEHRGFHRGDRRGWRDDRFTEGREGVFPSERGRFGGGPRGPFGEGFGPFGKGRGGFGGGRERLFDSGVMRLVILRELAQEPAYGYQLIKRLEERMAGGYRPSAGVIYPTLTMLEEQGFAAAQINEAGKKVYSVTPEGSQFLKDNQERLDDLENLMKSAGRGFARGRSP